MGDERLRALERAAAQGDPEALEALSRERARRFDEVESPEFQALRERGVDLQAPADLSLDLQGQLALDLQPLGERAGDALRFVTHGDPPEVLNVIGREDRDRLTLRQQDRDSSAERLAMLGELRSPPALLRLGLIYSRATGPWQEHGPNWLLQLLAAGLRARPRVPGLGDFVRYEGVVTCAAVLATLDFAKLETLPLLQVFFEAQGGEWRFSRAADYIRPEGINELAERHPDYLSEALSSGFHTNRIRTFDDMARLGIRIEPYFAELGRLAGHGRRAYGSRFQIQAVFRERYLAGEQRQEIRACLETALREGTPEERAELAAYVGDLCGQASRGALERAAARDRAPRVRQAAHQALDTLTLLSGNPNLDLDPLPSLDASAEAAFRAAFRDHPDLDTACVLLQEPTPWAPLPEPCLSAELSPLPLSELLDDFARTPSVHLGHVVRAVRLTGRLETWEENWRLRDQLRALDALARVWFEAQGEPASLSALGAAWGFLGLDERILGKVALVGDAMDRWFSAANGWECADYYRAYPDTLRSGLENVASGINEWRYSLLNEIEALVLQLQAQPEGFPESLHEAFTGLALSPAKSTRAVGQRVLKDEGEWLDEALIKELAARKAGRACAALEWLVERVPGHGGRVMAAKLAIAARLEVEKREPVREALEEALRTLPRTKGFRTPPKAKKRKPKKKRARRRS